ncbi:MAG: ABC transporter permease [Dehalococcoidales bacterium]|nr:ABC transporter permease [Dehalococcoidales bacterium]
MKNILTLAKWEVTRLRSRFGGKSRFIIIPVILLLVFLSYSIYQQDFTMCKGIYNIGLSPDGPVIEDQRFEISIMDRLTGERQLKAGIIDLYVGSTEVVVRKDDRSQYAAGSLQKYLEKQELARIAGQYPLDQAFPLRIRIETLATEGKIDPSAVQAALDPVLSLETDEPAIGQTAELSPDAPVFEIDNEETLVFETGTSGEPTADQSSSLAVQQQLGNIKAENKLPEFKAEFVAEDEIIVPSLMSPPMPLAQVILAFFYIIPVFFVSVFFTSSFTEEKVNRKLVILLSTPVSRLEIILGKMLPYFVYSFLVIVIVTLFLQGNVLTALGIFLPVVLFIFAIYLMVALTYRTFKDQTFFSVLALSVITIYLVVPAMFAGVSDLSYVSPLTLAVTMFRGETFSIDHYLIATIPLYLTFFLVMYVGTRVFNEEYLMGFKPLHRKLADALNMSLNKRRLSISIFILSFLLVPLVFAVQLVSIVIVSNLPSPFILWAVMLFSIVIEEIAKSAGIVAVMQRGVSVSRLSLFRLSFLSALGFWAGEKLLLVLTANLSAESQLVSAFFGTAFSSVWMLIIPLVLHTASTYLVCALSSRGSRKYPLALICGTVIHSVYDVSVLFFTGVMQ